METTSIISALGAGSGVDMAALATRLASAQFEGRSNRLTLKSETLERQISAASTLKNQMTELASALGERVRSGDLSPQPSIANAAVASVTTVSGFRPAGSYQLEVTALAGAQTLASPPFASATAATGSGTLTLRFGGISGGVFTADAARVAVDVTIAAGATLTDVAGAINASGAGVSAYVANTAAGAKLVLKGVDGAANAFVIEAVEDAGNPGLSALAWEPAAGDAARRTSNASDAVFAIDGLAMTSTSNLVTSPVPGINLTLLATNTGTPTRISFSNPVNAVQSVMQDLTTALNEIASELRTATDPQSGDLARDSGARALRAELARLAGSIIIPGALDGAPATLADLGLATERDGSFRLDTARLGATLTRDAAGAAAMFTTGLYGVFASIDRMARAASGVGNPGSLAGSVSRYTQQRTKLSSEQSKLAEQQETLRAQLAKRFGSADTRVAASRSTLTFLQNQIDLWSNSGN